MSYSEMLKQGYQLRGYISYKDGRECTWFSDKRGNVVIMEGHI